MSCSLIYTEWKPFSGCCCAKIMLVKNAWSSAFRTTAVTPHNTTCEPFPTSLCLWTGRSSVKCAWPSWAGSVNTAVCCRCRISRRRTACQRTGQNALCLQLHGGFLFRVYEHAPTFNFGDLLRYVQKEKTQDVKRRMLTTVYILTGVSKIAGSLMWNTLYMCT